MNLLKNLIQIQSYSGGEAKIAQFILKFLHKNNIPGRIQNGNVISFIPGRNQTKALIISAHMDTIQGEAAVRTKGGKVYGLGSSDDKGAIASILYLAKELETPPIDLWLTFVTKEETDGSGTEAFLKWYLASKYSKSYKIISAIIGEPTGLKTLEIGHRGNLFINLIVKGESGHSGKNYKATHLAISKALVALERIQKLNMRKYTDKLLGAPGINITGISATSNSPNQIPGGCKISLDIRTTPAIEGKILKMLKSAVGPDVEVTEIAKSRSSGKTSPQSHIVKCFQRAIPAIPLQISLGATDLSQFTKIGIPTVVFGPGEKEVMHKPNEFVEVKKVVECAKIYKRIIEEY